MAKGLHDEVRLISEKRRTSPWPQYLARLKITGLRGWTGQEVRFQFPVTAIAGENGSGKSTILKAAACAYNQSLPNTANYNLGQFFPETPWDKYASARVEYEIQIAGGSERVVISKPSERWRKSSKMRKRAVVFQDISRTLPIDATSGYLRIARRTIVESSSRSIDNSLQQYYSEILGRQYKNVRLAKTTRIPFARSALWKPAVRFFRSFIKAPVRLRHLI